MSHYKLKTDRKSSAFCPPISTTSSNISLLINGFLLACKAENKSPATISFYQNILTKFQWWLEKSDSEVIDATSIRQFLGYLKDTPKRWDSKNARANKPICAYTIDRYYTGLSALFRWSFEEGLLDANPIEKVKKPRFQRKIVKGLEAEICCELMNSFKDKSFLSQRNRAILFMFLDTGLRLSELANLRLSDVKGDIIKVQGKGNKERLVRIGSKTQQVLQAYLAQRGNDSDYLWISKQGHFTATGIQQMVRKLSKRLGIPFSPHKLRHSFAISFLRNGANPFELQLTLGHSTLEMTQKYTQALGYEDVFKRHVQASPVDNLREGDN